MSKTAVATISFESLKSMPAAKRRQVISRMPREEQKKVRVEEAREFETRLSRWSRAKAAVKSAASKVAGFFKRVAAKVVAAAKTVANHVVAFVMFPVVSIRSRQLVMPSWMWSIVDGVKAAGRFIARNWAAILCGIVFTAALVVAPVTTLVAAALAGLAYATTRASNSFVALVFAETLIRLAAEVFVIGFFASAERR